ncbi:MAG TPA: hypothetical protein VGB07_03145 [Blastocatellia bacterium]
MPDAELADADLADADLADAVLNTPLSGHNIAMTKKTEMDSFKQ